MELQARMINIAERRLRAGSRSAVDCHQARSNLAQTEAQIPQLRLAMREACDRLCVLLGESPTALEKELGAGPIPSAPPVIAVGIPADLLRRRPDVQRAERLAFAQGEQIGIAEAELYPMFAINGAIGVESDRLGELFTSRALTGTVGPVFQWNLLNYGRIRNNVRVQDARFQARVAAYQETVLRANAETEDGLAMFFSAQERAVMLDKSVASAHLAADLIAKDYQSGAADFNRVALIEQNLVQQQDLQAQSHGEIAQGLIQVYRALGGGWQVPPGEAVAAQAAVSVPSGQPHAAPPAAPLPPPATPQSPARPN
jgi:outer membrane protein TolC